MVLILTLIRTIFILIPTMPTAKLGSHNNKMNELDLTRLVIEPATFHIRSGR